MASIDRTAYPRFQSSLTATELQALYRPSDEELRFVVENARGNAGQLTLLTLLKCHQHRLLPTGVLDFSARFRYIGPLIPISAKHRPTIDHSEWSPSCFKALNCSTISDRLI